MAALRIELEATLRAAAEARAAVVAWLRDEHAGEAVVHDALVVVSELVTNSVRHAERPDEAVLLLSAERFDDSVRLAVHDDGTTGHVAPRPAETSGERLGGFGLQLVDRLATTWGVERDDGGTLVWARLAL
jgi:anti-sigma regulatory factor (Ser/Thr protein kinase)